MTDSAIHKPVGSSGSRTQSAAPFSLLGQWLLELTTEGPPADLIEQLLVDQQARWRNEPGPRVEEYLHHCPFIADSEESLVDLVYGEARAREKLGFLTQPAEYSRRFPAVAEALERQFELANWCNAAVREQEAVSADDFGPYEVMATIARGGMGMVLKARHREWGRVVALKMIPAEQLGSLEKQRFETEVLAITQLDHSGIISIYDVGTYHGTPYFTMPYLENGSLVDNLAHFRGQPRRIAEALQHAAAAIHHAHQRGILHRDIKPSNVLVDRNFKSVVSDFGLAKLTQRDTHLTAPQDLVGTPVWLAPEQAARRPQPQTIAADVYGLGAVLYFLLTERAPYDGHGLLETLDKIRHGEPVAPSRVIPQTDPDLEMICLKAMDRDPARRYESAEAFEQDLARYLEGRALIARPYFWSGVLRRFGRW